MVNRGTIRVTTRDRIELQDITDEVAEIVRGFGVGSGILLLHTPHTTAALIVNENEAGLVSDLALEMGRLVDWKADYQHNRIDNNAPSHITGAVLGASIGLPVTDGKIALGTWQSIFFVELDGPRSRRVEAVIVGE